jgi:hypothetical protein
MWKPWFVIIVCSANNRDSISFFRFSNLQWISAFTKVPSTLVKVACSQSSYNTQITRLLDCSGQLKKVKLNELENLARPPLFWTVVGHPQAGQRGQEESQEEAGGGHLEEEDDRTGGHWTGGTGLGEDRTGGVQDWGSTGLRGLYSTCRLAFILYSRIFPRIVVTS